MADARIEGFGDCGSGCIMYVPAFLIVLARAVGIGRCVQRRYLRGHQCYQHMGVPACLYEVRRNGRSLGV